MGRREGPFLHLIGVSHLLKAAGEAYTRVKTISDLEIPLEPLLEKLGKYPAMVAREQSARLNEIKQALSVRIRLIRGKGNLRFSAGKDRHTGERYVKVGLAALERIWAYCYGFTFLFDLVKSRPQGSLIEMKNMPEASLPWELLRWAKVGEDKQVRFEWPNYFPKPGAESTDTYVKNTDNFFITVVGFLLLHEIGHHSLGHLDEPEDLHQFVNQEFQADDFAADLMLTHCPRESVKDILFVARANGISTGLALLAGIELDHPASVIRTHPKVPERLLTVFQKYIPEDRMNPHVPEYPMYFASVLISAFMQNCGIDFPYAASHESYTDFFIKCMHAFP
jgi:peptidase U49-like protein